MPARFFTCSNSAPRSTFSETTTERGNETTTHLRILPNPSSSFSPLSVTWEVPEPKLCLDVISFVLLSSRHLTCHWSLKFEIKQIRPLKNDDVIQIPDIPPPSNSMSCSCLQFWRHGTRTWSELAQRYSPQAFLHASTANSLRRCGCTYSTPHMSPR